MNYWIIQGDAGRLPLADQSVDLVFGSPPYMDARTYSRDDVSRDCQEWVEWMLAVTTEAVRVSRGLVLWVVSGVQRAGCYWPGCEGLAWEWWKRGNQLWRPCIWWKVDVNEGGTGIPGSGGKQWLRNDWEYVLAFKREGWLPWADPLVMGHEPVYSAVGGEMSNRTAAGQRINARPGVGVKVRRASWARAGTNRRRNGKYKKTMDVTQGHDDNGNLNANGKRPMPKIANPGNVLAHLPLDEWMGGIVKARVGGGHMGNKLCHLSEAPFPEALAEFFIRSFAPSSGWVLDPFVGSGTTLAVAKRFGRNGIGLDIRESQCQLMWRRLESAPPELFVE